MVITKVALNVGVNQLIVCRDLFALSILAPLAYFRESTVRVNMLSIEGQTKIGGTLVCVLGAIFMVLFKRLVLLGDKDADFAMNNEISVKGQPEPTGWLVSGFLDLGFEQWHIALFTSKINSFCFFDIFVIHFTFFTSKIFQLGIWDRVSWCKNLGTSDV